MIGTDPEFFVVDENGKPVPAWRFYPPKSGALYVNTKNDMYFRDGYVLELNTAPETCRGRFGNALARTLHVAMARLPKGYTLTTNAAMKIDLADMMIDVPPDAQVFGCDASYNAYEEAELAINLDAMDHEYRYAGGHMHYSGNSTTPFLSSSHNKFLFGKLCDLFIGLPLAYLYDDEDEILRRRYYGKAGEMRMQTYPANTIGVEYRTPSPRIYNDYRIASMLFGVMRNLTVYFPSAASLWRKEWEKPLQHAINNCEVSPKMLQTASGFYTPQLLIDIKKQQCFNKFAFKHPYADYHTAFTEWVQDKYRGSNDNYGSYAEQRSWQKMLGYKPNQYDQWEGQERFDHLHFPEGR